MLPECQPGGQRIVVAPNIRMLGALDIDIEVAEKAVPELYIGQRELLPHEERER